MSPDHLEGDHPRHSAVEGQFLCAIYSRPAQAASVTAVNLQLAVRHGGNCEYVEAFAELPTSDDQFILPNGETEPVLSGTADNLESFECESGTLLADEENS
jgi:hypothetical protein